MSPEDRTIAANLLGDAAAIAGDAGTSENARLLRIAEAAIGGVALGDNATIAALFQRHKTELERLRRRAASAGGAASVIEEPARVDEPAMVPAEEPVQAVAAQDARAEAQPAEPAQAAEPPAEAPAPRARKRAPRRQKSVK